MNHIFIFSFWFALCFNFHSNPNKIQKDADIRLHFSGIKTQKGEILIAMFNNETGFPEDGSKAFKTWKFSPASTITLQNIPPGTYAITLLHDLDNNQKMTFNLFGIPKDGYSSTPDGGPRFSKPKYKSSLFQHSSKPTDLNLKMHY